jgi:hypothetical protein
MFCFQKIEVLIEFLSNTYYEMQATTIIHINVKIKLIDKRQLFRRHIHKLSPLPWNI